MRRTARRLDAALAGAELVRADLRVPRFATVDLRGATVLGTATVGKHLLTRMLLGERAVTLHHHLRMDGSWRIGPPGPPRAPAHLIRVWLASAQQQAVGVHLHEVAVGPTAREAQWIGHLGPDVLAEGFDLAAAAERVLASGRPLVESLLDQRILCGLGTMWAAEAAFAAGADPWTLGPGGPGGPGVPGGSGGPRVPALAGALGEIRDRMLAAVDSPRGATPTPLMVFERTGQPCRRCGTAIRSGRVGQAPYDRVTYWCPTCQR